ncbi:MAG: hypothetical protein QM817_30235 [Archangium sp.]
MFRSWLVLALTLVACGPAAEMDAGTTIPDASTMIDAGTPDAGTPDAGTPDAGTPDAGTPDAGIPDAGTPDAGLVVTWKFPSCMGPALPLQRSGQLLYVDATLGTGTTAQAAAFLIDFGSTNSWVDLGAFSQPAQLSCTATTCTYADFDFFGSWGQVTLLTSDFSQFMGPPRQAGIIGTDFLSVRPTTIDFVTRRIISSPASSFCTPAQLEDAGFVGMPSTGFYVNNLNNLLPLSTIVQDAGPGTTVPNVPTLLLRLDGVVAYAQLDTGFDDAVVPNSININVPFLNEILMRAPTALVRSPAMDLRLTTCVGVDEPVTAWRLASGHSLEFVGLDGGTGHRISNAVLFAKETPPAARVCGGIGTWNANGAQVAASHYFSAGAVVFDPVRSTVWMPQ